MLFCIFVRIGTFYLDADPAEVASESPGIKQKFVSPSERFLAKHSFDRIQAKLAAEGFDLQDCPLFQKLIEAETEGFIGYHGGCSDYRLFQDLIRFVVEEILYIRVRDDFHFLRVPASNGLDFVTAEAFLEGTVDNIDDTIPDTRKQLLSLNIALFQYYDLPSDFTPRYFIQNGSWSKPDYWKLLLDFAEQAGIRAEDFKPIIALGRSLLAEDRGILIQFFVRPDQSTPYSYLDAHFYAAYTKGKPCGALPPSYYIMNPEIFEFPQLRLVINNADILNPFSYLQMKRYDACSEDDRKMYDKILRSSIRSLSTDAEKQTAARNQLLSTWSMYLLHYFPSSDN